jgi:hypothetical protein
MSLYTSTYLTQLTDSNASFLSTRERLFTESVRETATFDIFLSHSYLDRREVLGIYVELTKAGFEVYVDWIVDPHLDRTKVTKSSAELVRKRMRSSKSLLLAMSSNAEVSKWIPWELGYVDGRTQKCALFPVSKSYAVSRTFQRSEYLLLYPYIKRAAIGTSYEKMFITESSNYYTEFDGWFRRNDSIAYKTQNIDIL